MDRLLIMTCPELATPKLLIRRRAGTCWRTMVENRRFTASMGERVFRDRNFSESSRVSLLKYELSIFGDI